MLKFSSGKILVTNITALLRKKAKVSFYYISLLSFNQSVMSDSFWFHGLQHIRLPCLSPYNKACLNSCPLSWWCHPTISSSVVPFSSCLQSFSASVSFLRSQPSHQVAKVLELQLWHQSLQWIFRIDFLYDWLVWSLCIQGTHPRGLSRVFSNTIIQKHQFFGAQPS